VKGVRRKNCPSASSLPPPSFCLTPRPLQQPCTGHDTRFGLTQTDSEGLRPVCVFGKGRRLMEPAGSWVGTAYARLPRSHAAFLLPRGTPKWGRLGFSPAGDPEFAPQHQKVVVSWIGLAVAFLAIRVPSKRSSGGWVPSKSSRWMVVLGRKMETWRV